VRDECSDRSKRRDSDKKFIKTKTRRLSVFQQIECEFKAKVIEDAVYESLRKDETKADRVSRTTFNVFKNGKPYTDMANDTELYKISGLH
jgi:hypothetical protein